MKPLRLTGMMWLGSFVNSDQREETWTRQPSSDSSDSEKPVNPLLLHNEVKTLANNQTKALRITTVDYISRFITQGIASFLGHQHLSLMILSMDSYPDIRQCFISAAFYTRITIIQ